MYVCTYVYIYVCVYYLRRYVCMYACMYLFICTLFNVAVNSQFPVTSSSNRLVDN
jgi:hypothetical protein